MPSCQQRHPRALAESTVSVLCQKPPGHPNSSSPPLLAVRITNPLGLGFLDKLSSHSVPPGAFQWLWEHRACGVPAPPTTTDYLDSNALSLSPHPALAVASPSAQGSECPAHLPPTQSPSVSSLSRAGPSGLIQRFLGSAPNLTPTL